MSGWNTIESDAGVFTQLVTDLGIEGIQFEDIPYLDYIEEQLSQVLYGIVFLFPYTPSLYDGNSSGSPIQGRYETDPSKIFFSQQTIQNACATQAVINSLFNLAIENKNAIHLGKEMSRFYEFVMDFHQSALIGETINNSDLIRNVHNSFTPPNPFEVDQDTSSRQGKSDEIFHFVSFIPYNSKIYELDGLQPSPIDHGPYTDFPKAVTKILQDRINKMVGFGLQKFNLIGIVRDKMDYYQELLESDSIDDSEQFIIAEQLQQEMANRERWAEEISFRRLNLTGLVLTLIKQISSSMTDDEFRNRLLAISRKPNDS